MLTTGDVAKYCGVNFRTVSRWIKQGYIKAHQLPGRGDNRISVQEFLNFLKKNNIPVPDEFQQFAKKVLIVDDDPSMTGFLFRLLSDEGFETEVASDGFQAGNILGTFLPSIITLDLQMPGLHGIDVVKYIRSKKEYDGVKILIVSGAGQKQIDKALEAGANDFLSKPFENEDLIEKIYSQLGIEREIDTV